MKKKEAQMKKKKGGKLGKTVAKIRGWMVGMRERAEKSQWFLAVVIQLFNHGTYVPTRIVRVKIKTLHYPNDISKLTSIVVSSSRFWRLFAVV